MRLRSMLAFGLGYLWGTKAGRERYQELTQSLRNVAGSDLAKDAMTKAREAIGLQGQQNGSGRSSGEETTESQSGQEHSGETDSNEEGQDWQQQEDGAWVPQGEAQGDQQGDDQSGQHHEEQASEHQG